MPIHQWNMSGKMHAVQGTFANSDFRDTYANQKIGCLPICYRIRDRPKQYYVMDHSFDFWSEAFVAYTAPVPAGFVLQTCAEEPDWEFVPASSWASQSSSSSTENKEQLSGTIAGRAWQMGAEAEGESACMVCLSRPPTMVFKACGHCGLCGHCWKWMCKEQFNKNKSEKCKVSPAALKTTRIANVAFKCPACRQVTQAVHHSKYTESVYWV